jgi:hypothetical protein
LIFISILKLSVQNKTQPNQALCHHQGHTWLEAAERFSWGDAVMIDVNSV